MGMMANDLPAAQLGAVLWDMDGTVIDTEPLWLRAEHAMLARYGIAMTDSVSDALVGTGLRAGAELFQSLGVPMSVDAIVAEWVRGVAQAMDETPPAWRPGAIELLESLRHASIPCVLVTMSVRELAEQVVTKLPEATFSGIIAGDEVEFEKPHPEPYLRGAASVGVPIQNCLAIEDSLPGLTSAAASGAVAVGVPHLVPLDAAPAHVRIPTLEGLTSADVLGFFAAHAGSSPAAGVSEGARC